MGRLFTLFFIIFCGFLNYKVSAQLSLTDFDIAHLIDFDATVSGVNNGQLVLNNAPIATPTAGRLDSDAWTLTPNSNFTGQSNGGVTTGGWYSFLVNTGSRAIGAQPTGSAPNTNHSFVLTIINNTGSIIEEMDVSFRLYAGAPEGRNSTITFSTSSGTGGSGTETTDNILANGTATIGTWRYITRNLSITSLNILNNQTYTLTVSVDRGSLSGSSDEWAIDDISFTPRSLNPNTINLSRTSAAGFTYAFGSGPSATDTFRISGNDLVPSGGNIGLKASAIFEISTSPSGPFSDTISVSYSGGALSATTIYVRMVAGLSTGAQTGTITASGGEAPVKTLNLSGEVTPGPCGDLFFSEYVEGTSNNRYIEIYNPTSNPVILRDPSTSYYRIALFANGNTSPTIILFPANSTIAPYSTFVMSHTSGTIYSADATSGSLAFTGNDALSLQKINSSIWTDIDVFGEIGSDPGTAWTVSGNTTVDRTLIRRPEVRTGAPSEAGFPRLGTEWIQYAVNESHHLGGHVSACQYTHYTIASVDGISPVSYCPGSPISIPFSASGVYGAGNVFTAQFSNSSGSFSSPVNIGTVSLSGTDPSGTINATIPVAATAGSPYHIRISSSNPAGGMIVNGQEITVNSTTPPVVTNVNGTQASNATTLTWSNPVTGCWEEVMAVISTSSGFIFTPSGNGSAYTANPIYSGAGNQVIYKGSGESVNVSGLANGTVYYFKIFTRNGTTWSAAAEYEILVDPYCYPKYTYPPVSPSIGSCDEYISRVTVNTLNNSSGGGCGYNGYSWYANQSTTLVKGQTYEITVQVGIVGSSNDESYAGDDLRIWIDWNGDGNLSNTGGERIINNLNNGASGAYTFTVPADAVTGSVRLRAQLFYYESTDPTSSCGKTFRDGETEDYTINIIDACTPVTTPFTFYPREGSAGTEIRISRTSGAGNFTQVDSVFIGGIKATSFRIVDDFTIFAIVPEGAETGRVILYDNSPCQRTSAAIFTYLSKAGSCNIYSDLIISEVFDTVGNVHYIELFNGTNSSINLSTPNNYTIRILNKDNYSHANPVTHTINITGTIPAGETRVYYAGSTGPKVTGTQSNIGSGFNAYDDIILAKNGTAIDIFTAPPTTIFNYRRNNTATAPSGTYISGDWTSYTPVNSSNIGIFVPITPITIDVHPADVTGCEIDLNVSATGTGLSYQWYYNDNKTTDQVWRNADSLIVLYPLVTVSGANSTDLLVTGDLAALDNFQFYCVVSGTGCAQYSRAARFTIQPDPYFRSRQSGDWRSAFSWEMSPNGLPGTWVDACTFPWDTNSVSVVIQNGHTISIAEAGVNPDVQISRLTIDNGGILDLAANADVFLTNNTGTDLVVNGTLYDRTTGAGNGLSFISSSTWALGNDGIFIKSGTTSLIDYIDQYENGISEVPASAHWIFRKETGSTAFPVANNMFYPNLYFEDVNAGDANFSLSGNLGFATVKGNLYVGDTGRTVIVNNTNSFGTPMRVLGNIRIGNGSTFRINHASTPGTGLEAAGNIMNNGTLDLNHLNSGILRLNGTGNQTISGTGIFDIWNLHINKVPQSLAILDTNIEVKNQLSFNGGIISVPGLSDTLFISNGDPVNAITGHDIPNGTGVYSNDNYVTGNLRRRIDVPASVYVFPVGDNANTGLGYNPARLTIRALPGAASSATGRFVPAWPGTINTFRFITCGSSTNFIEYRGLTNEGYWQFDGSSFVNYDINIHPNIANQNVLPNEDTELGHNSNYRALKENSAQAGAVWDPDVSVLGNPCIVSYNYYDIVGAGYTGFSIFAPGGGNGNTTALPIELLYFNIDCQPAPAIHWATASELNTDYFTIEQSPDGHLFSPVAHIGAAGNSTHKIEYSYTPDNESNGLYYRLTETDLDGSIYYHGIIHSDCSVKNQGKTKIFYQYGNGIIAQFEHRRIPVAIQVHDAAGRFIYTENISGGLNSLNISSATQWAKGMYFVSLLYSDNDMITEKVVVY